MSDERGFTLIDAMVASAIALLLGWQLLAMTHATVFAAAHLDGRLRAYASANRLEERLEADAATAWSAFVPPTDVNGRSNADGHELNFATRDASHRSYWWAYVYEPAGKRVTRYAYAPGEPPVPGERYDDLAGFRARAHPMTDIVNPKSDAYDPLFADATVSDVTVDFGWNPVAVGGNRAIAVAVSAEGSDRRFLLATAAAPSHFTIVVQYTPAPTASP